MYTINNKYIIILEVINLRSKLTKILPALLMVSALVITFSFITGFTQSDLNILGSESTEIQEDASVKWECSLCGYTYESDADSTPFNGLPDDWSCPNPDCSGTKLDFKEFIAVSWICPYCGYIYDPELEVTLFEELPSDWTCPGCNGLKSDFVNYEEYGNYIILDPWLIHLQHVLAMRSKHLAVLESVIEAHETKKEEHSSLSGLGNAYVSSSKSVLRAKAEIDAYIAGLILTTVDQQSEENTENEDVIIDSEDTEGQNTGSENDKEYNNGNKDGKGNKEQSGNGKANGKKK